MLIVAKTLEQYPIQDTRYKIQDTRYKIQDTRYKIQDTRYYLALFYVCQAPFEAIPYKGLGV
jgi:hypothetical protein